MPFDQRGRRFLRLASQPAGQSGQEASKRGAVNHGGSLHQRPRDKPSTQIGGAMGHYALRTSFRPPTWAH